MTYRSYAVDVWWKTGNSIRICDHVPLAEARREARRVKWNDAVACVKIVRVIVTETVVEDWKA